MDFVIWGAGYRGKHACQFIGKDRTVAFIDNNPKKQGEKVYGIEIISYQQYRERYQDKFLIVSPNNSDEIIKILEDDKEYKYFVLSEEIGECFGWGQKDILECLLEKANKNLTNIILGFNLVCMILMDELKKRGYGEVRLVPHRTIRAEMINVMKYYFPCEFLENIENIQQEANIFIAKGDVCINDNCKYHIYNARNFFKQYSGYYNAELEKFRDAYQNERCVIVATGPSLRALDLDLLHKKNILTFSMNKVFHIFDQTEWRPDFYFVNDRLIIQQNLNILNDLQIKNKFVGDNYHKGLGTEFLRYHLSVNEGSFDYVQDFSDDAAWGIYHGATVTYSCIQFAVYMGFHEIYLLGVDFNYGKMGMEGNHFYKEEDKVNLPFCKDGSLKAYQIARKYADEHNIRIFNATRGGKLEVFERVDFDTIFNG